MTTVRLFLRKGSIRKGSRGYTDNGVVECLFDHCLRKQDGSYYIEVPLTDLNGLHPAVIRRVVRVSARCPLRGSNRATGKYRNDEVAPGAEGLVDFSGALFVHVTATTIAAMLALYDMIRAGTILPYLNYDRRQVEPSSSTSVPSNDATAAEETSPTGVPASTDPAVEDPAQVDGQPTE